MSHQDIAKSLIERCSRYAAPGSFSLYKFWVDDAEEATPGISESVRLASLSFLNVASGALLRSAIQALAVTGNLNDVVMLTDMIGKVESSLVSEIDAATKYLMKKNKTPEQLLGEVVDRETFVDFVLALAAERERAEKLERENPQRYCIDGALGWKNADVSAYLHASLSGLEGEPQSLQPSWYEFARILYSGKVYE